VGVENAKSMGFGSVADVAQKSKENMVASLKQFFKPEMLGRLEIAAFNALTMEQIREVVKKEIENVNARLVADEVNARIVYSDEVITFLTKNGYTPALGARNIRKQVQDHIEDALVDEFLEGKITEGSVIRFEVVENKLSHTIERLS